MIDSFMIDEKLWQLQKACHSYKETDCLADWVLFAVTRYINTGRATNEFLKQFCGIPENRMVPIIKTCLNGDKSDDGIMKSFRAAMRRK